ncbi:MAG: hypothetical protein HKL80_03015 [Acidimicrobiales bacterium]|nr:hypothetical protein [Acidimicrobiales bacterium]
MALRISIGFSLAKERSESLECIESRTVLARKDRDSQFFAAIRLLRLIAANSSSDQCWHSNDKPTFLLLAVSRIISASAKAMGFLVSTVEQSADHQLDRVAVDRSFTD